MHKGYASLSKKRLVTDGEPQHSETLDSEAVAPLPDSTKHGNLHIVSVARSGYDPRYVAGIASKHADDGSFYYLSKRILDIVGAVLVFLLLSPLILVIVLCACSSGESALFRHRRVGQSGKTFDCMKFRTMVPNADQVLQNLLNSNREIKEEWLRDHKLRDDPRVTRLGKFLRKTSLDELPQLWNVLRGEMSLVGPRPVVPDELGRYGNHAATFLSARPGITGLWQISGRNDTDYRRRVALDVCYVRSRSTLLDFYILLKTVPVVFARSGAY